MTGAPDAGGAWCVLGADRVVDLGRGFGLVGVGVGVTRRDVAALDVVGGGATDELAGLLLGVGAAALDDVPQAAALATAATASRATATRRDCFRQRLIPPR